jgi:putative tryptophan/tyrosine transport system substrate-binding protein
MIDRRSFMASIAGGLVIAHSAAEAQPAAKVYRIGILLGATAETVAPLVRALTEGLRDLGYVEGRNIVFERRYADGRVERLPDLAAELVRLRVDVIVTGSNVHVAAAQRATAAIPIVMVAAGDPVGAGFIASLARPGGNITGLSADASREIQAKNLALLKEIVPRLSRVGVVGQVQSPGGVAALEAAAQQLNVALEVVNIRSPDDFESAFAAMVGKRVGAVIVGAGPLTYMRRQQIADLALKHRLPAITTLNEFAQAGLLMSYGPNLPDMYRRAATYVAKILRGAKPAELPVEQPTKFELVINLKTAKALGLTIPQSLLLRADEVIQ